MDERDEGRVPGSHAGDQVGLGRVIDDRLSSGSPDTDDPGAIADPLLGTTRTGAAGTDADVEEASEDSFPASDPPMFTAAPATPANRELRHTRGGEAAIEPPDPRDVP